MTTLQQQIDERRKEIHTDSYPMSIGELISVYRDGEMDLHPEFQRFFRWSTLQKSKLIESLLLGIPLPSVFVAQRDDGVWDVVDGLQRLSTIFEFAGILKDENNAPIAASSLVATEYLPELEGIYWEDTEPPSSRKCLDSTQRMLLKRTKIDLNIIKRESPTNTKLELFHRLNSLATPLSDQENRDCLLLMANRIHFDWALARRQNEDFLATISLSERLTEQKYDTELVWRFVLLRSSTVEELRKVSDYAAFLTAGTLAMATGKRPLDLASEHRVFDETFKLLNAALGDSVFKKFDADRNAFQRSFLVSAYEAIAVGLSFNLDRYRGADGAARIAAAVKAMWSDEQFTDFIGSGVTPARRMSHIVPRGKEIFAGG